MRDNVDSERLALCICTTHEEISKQRKRTYGSAAGAIVS